MAGYGLAQLQQHMERQGLDALGRVANQQEQNERLEKSMDAAEKTRTMSSVATGAGIGFSVAGPVGAGIGAAAGFIFDSLF